MKQLYKLVNLDVRRRCWEAIKSAPDGWIVRIEEPTKKRVQEEKYHAMIGEIAKQTTYAGKQWDVEDMKRILIDEFAYELRCAGEPLHHDSRIIPSEDGQRIIPLNVRSSEFYVKEAAKFIEFLEAWGADKGVKFTEPTCFP